LRHSVYTIVGALYAMRPFGYRKAIRPIEPRGPRDAHHERTHCKTRSSATAEIARDADDIDYKFSKVAVHLIKKRHHRIPFRLAQYYAK